MALGRVLGGALRNTRRFVEGFLGRVQNAGRLGRTVDVVRGELEPLHLHTNHTKGGLFIERLAKYARRNLATELRRQFSKSPIYREYNGLASKMAMFAFVGVGVASGTDDGLELTGISEHIRNCFNARQFNMMEDPIHNPSDHTLDDYQLGSIIGKGCNAVVYSAKYMAYDRPEKRGMHPVEFPRNVYTTFEDTPDTLSDVVNDEISGCTVFMESGSQSDIEVIDEEECTDTEQFLSSSLLLDKDADTGSDIEVIEDEFPPGIFVVSVEAPGITASVEAGSQSDIEVIEEQELTAVEDYTLSNTVLDVGSDIEVIEDEFPPGIFIVNKETPGVTASVETGCQSDNEITDEQEVIDATLSVSSLLPKEQVHHDVTEGETSWLSQGQDLEENSDWNIAMKIMYNYSIESNASELYRHMAKELLPAQANTFQETHELWHNRHRNKGNCQLPGHPNIVTMYGGFVDDFPFLSEALKVYPCALPPRINPEGCGRNRTLFIVMKRYPYTLREYLQVKHDLSFRHSTLLLLQLVEAVVHMTEHGVVHRDLKSDNIFVEEIDDCPHLVVSDFGESIHFDQKENLCLPYMTDEINKGGNSVLQAPEIACAVPGRNKFLDYRKSDLWTVGTLAYEIFGMSNPFYEMADGERLQSTTYSEDNLPSLDHVPDVLARLIRNMLSRDPNQRCSPRQISICLHLLLWSPLEWTVSLNVRSANKLTYPPTELNLYRWILLLTAQVLLEQLTRYQRVEHELRRLFLSRFDFKELVQCAKFIESVN